MILLHSNLDISMPLAPETGVIRFYLGQPYSNCSTQQSLSADLIESPGRQVLTGLLEAFFWIPQFAHNNSAERRIDLASQNAHAIRASIAYTRSLLLVLQDCKVPTVADTLFTVVKGPHPRDPLHQVSQSAR
jgi:hypothetical protein